MWGRQKRRGGRGGSGMSENGRGTAESERTNLVREGWRYKKTVRNHARKMRKIKRNGIKREGVLYPKRK